MLHSHWLASLYPTQFNKIKMISAGFYFSDKNCVVYPCAYSLKLTNFTHVSENDFDNIIGNLLQHLSSVINGLQVLLNMC